METLDCLLAPWGLTTPTTDRDMDLMIDRFVSAKEKTPDNPRVDAVLQAIGQRLCNFESEGLAA